MSKPARNTDLSKLDPRLAKLVRKIIQDANRHEAARYTRGEVPSLAWWHVFEGFRSAELQAYYYTSGRTRPGPILTNLDGVKKKGRHQSGRAVDLVAKVNGKWTWDVRKADYAYVGHLARQAGLTWGGDWDRLVDMPHIEIKD